METQSITSELKSMIGRRLQEAAPEDVFAIMGVLAESEAARSRISAATPLPVRIAQRFEIIDAEREQVLDRSTGLIWLRGNVPGGRMKWAEAREACSGLRVGARSDWRLPSIKELLSIVDHDRNEPAIDTSFFHCEASWYWSSTPLKSSPSVCAWGVSFGLGGADCSLHVYGGFVRAVRPGQF